MIWTVTQYQQTFMTDAKPCWLASDPTLPGCHGYGRTQAEADDSMSRARRAYLRHGGQQLATCTR